ncbi:MAG: hypothetical protein LUG44_02950, partial [Clostridiales bacterium]|nr:hypothetical protein [Clostridiales bacterium]
MTKLLLSFMLVPKCAAPPRGAAKTKAFCTRPPHRFATAQERKFFMVNRFVLNGISYHGKGA